MRSKPFPSACCRQCRPCSSCSTAHAGREGRLHGEPQHQPQCSRPSPAWGGRSRSAHSPTASRRRAMCCAACRWAWAGLGWRERACVVAPQLPCTCCSPAAAAAAAAAARSTWRCSSAAHACQWGRCQRARQQHAAHPCAARARHVQKYMQDKRGIDNVYKALVMRAWAEPLRWAGRQARQRERAHAAHACTRARHHHGTCRPRGAPNMQSTRCQWTHGPGPAHSTPMHGCLTPPRPPLTPLPPRSQAVFDKVVSIFKQCLLRCGSPHMRARAPGHTGLRMPPSCAGC